jgi:hypothetical protein
MGRMFQLSFDSAFNLTIKCDVALPVDAGNKLMILDEYRKVYSQYKLMSDWYDDPQQGTPEQKAKYKNHVHNAYYGMMYMREFAEICGIPREEIKVFADLPF